MLSSVHKILTDIFSKNFGCSTLSPSLSSSSSPPLTYTSAPEQRTPCEAPQPRFRRTKFTLLAFWGFSFEGLRLWCLGTFGRWRFRSRGFSFWLWVRWVVRGVIFFLRGEDTDLTFLFGVPYGEFRTTGFSFRVFSPFAWLISPPQTPSFEAHSLFPVGLLNQTKNSNHSLPSSCPNSPFLKISANAASRSPSTTSNFTYTPSSISSPYQSALSPSSLFLLFSLYLLPCIFHKMLHSTRSSSFQTLTLIWRTSVSRKSCTANPIWSWFFWVEWIIWFWFRWFRRVDRWGFWVPRTVRWGRDGV